VHRILDAACGVGTQAIGLAQLGYNVVASDISLLAIERARKEASAHGVGISFVNDDIRSLSKAKDDSFDLVIACDNAIPHLLTDEEIRTAFRSMYRCASSQGGCLISVRNYDASESGVKIVPYGLQAVGKTRYLVFQVWEYHGAIYDLSMYFIEDTDSQCTSHVMRTQYYAVPVVRLIELMAEAGFQQVQRIEDRFFQTLIVGMKKAPHSEDTKKQSSRSKHFR
jgi:ubiquinone/menaquinone biosynthesis C-methylase UbiE